MVWKGIVLGFSIAAPVGPIGLLCIRRTLADGRAAGLTTGLGAAAADCAYGFMAALGLTAVSSILVSHQWWIQLLGGLFLCYLGISTFLSKPANAPANLQSSGLWLNFGSTFLLTIMNPMTILSFVAVFAGLGLASAGVAYGESAMLVLGVFVGSAAWWFLLSGLTSMLRQKVTTGAMQWVNRASGVLVLCFG